LDAESLSDGWNDMGENDVVRCGVVSTAFKAPPSIIYLRRSIFTFHLFFTMRKVTDRTNDPRSSVWWMADDRAAGGHRRSGFAAP
jgi:hypothetical protein